MKCIKCNGDMIGDGYASPMHCEYAEPLEDAEADSGPWYCDFEDDRPTLVGVDYASKKGAFWSRIK